MAAVLASQTDFVGVYLTASMGVGQRLHLATIDERLRTLPLDRAIVLLSEMSCRAAKASDVTDPQSQIKLAQQVFPTSFLSAAEPLLRRQVPRTAALSPQVVVLLGIRLLSVSPCASTRARVIEQTDPQLARALGALCLAFSDHVDTGALTAETTTVELLRLGLFYGRSQHAAWLTLAYRLFFEELPQTESAIDPLTAFQSSTGVTLERFWAITVMQGALAASSPQSPLPASMESTAVTAEDIGAWCSLMFISIEDARIAARYDMSKPIGWSMTAVWKRPVIELASGVGRSLRGELIQMQAEPAQLFWHVRDVLVANGTPHQTWSNLYGQAVERLGLRLLTEHLPAGLVKDESALVQEWSIPTGAKRADAAVVDAGSLVVIDFVSRQFTAATTSTGDFDSLVNDVGKAVVDKLQQIDSTLAYAVASDALWTAFYPLVVTAGPFPTSPLIDVVVEKQLQPLDLKVIGVGPRCRPWMVMDLASFLLLLRIASLSRRTIAAVLDEWQGSALSRHEFWQWAFRNGPAQSLGDDLLPTLWHERAFEALGAEPERYA
jgi:hypothetical protein